MAAAPLTLFEPARFAAALVSGLADVFAAFVMSEAAAEVRTATGPLADFPAPRFAALAAGFLATEEAAGLAWATARAGSGEPLPEPGTLRFPAPVAFPPVVFAIALSPLL